MLRSELQSMKKMFTFSMKCLAPQHGKYAGLLGSGLQVSSAASLSFLSDSDKLRTLPQTVLARLRLQLQVRDFEAG